MEEVLEYLEQVTNLELILIPANTFVMGSPASEIGRRRNETQHEVTITKPFYLGKYAVTQGQWESVGMKNRSDTIQPNFPVTKVSWEDCQEFIKKLNTKTNGDYRLPTEAEWEYACRAGTRTAYSFGNEITRGNANFGEPFTPPNDQSSNDIQSGIKPVGTYMPNAFGLYDMHGNVWEWCEDWFGEYPAGSVTDPKGPSEGEKRVLRGGSFNFKVSKTRSAYRDSITPTYRYNNNGFRLARTK